MNLERALAALTIALVLVNAPGAMATDPSEHCATRDQLVPLLTGPVHNERQILVLEDEMLSQGHSFELFMNRGEGGRHSYTLIRTRRANHLSCIVTAGLVAKPYVDERGHTQLILRDENDPDTFNVSTHKNRYVITRESEEQKIRDYFSKSNGTDAPVVSYGHIMSDLR